MKSRNLPKLYQWGVRYPIWVLAGCILTALISFHFAKKLTLLTDFAALLPQQTESVKNLNHLKENFGSFSHLVVTVEADDPSEAEQFAERLALKVEQNPEIRYVDYKGPVEFFKKRFWLYLEPADLKEMERRLNRSLELQKHGVSPAFAELMDFADEENRPDLTFEDIRKKYEEKFIGKSKDSEDAFEILWVKPKQSAGDFDYNRKIIAQVENTVSQLKKEEGFSSVKVGYTGDYQSTIEEAALVGREIAWVSMVVTALLFLILILYFRKLSSAFLIGFPLTVSVLWTGALMYAILGHLNIMTGFGAAILAGLGSDYGIYLLTRFYNERAGGASFEKACDLAFGSTGKATFGSMVTTVASFVALLFSKFGVFVEFGVVGALGLVMNYIGMMLILPSLLSLAHRWEKTPFFSKIQTWDRFGKQHSHLGSFLVQKIFTPKGAVVGLVAAFLLLGVSFLTLPGQTKIYFEDGQMDTKDLPSNQLDRRVSEANWNTTHPAVLLTQGEEEENRTVNLLQKELDEKPQDSLVFKKVMGISSFIPKDQGEKRAFLEKFVEKFGKAQLINKDQKAKTIRSLKDTLASSDVARENLPDAVKRRFESPKRNGVYAVYLYPSIERSGSENIEKYTQGIAALKSALGLSFIPVDGAFIQHDIIQLIRKEAPRGLILVLLFFGVFLFFTVRPAKRALVIFSNLLASLILLSGALWLAGIRLNVMNIALIPIVLGTGIDCFIHFSHRFDEESDLGAIIRDEVPAIFISSLTSIVGFGGLVLTSSLGLRSVGWLAVFGLAIVTLVCALVFPRLLMLENPRKTSSVSLKKETVAA